jgi:hypothetical protein
MANPQRCRSVYHPNQNTYTDLSALEPLRRDAEWFGPKKPLSESERGWGEVNLPTR